MSEAKYTPGPWQQWKGQVFIQNPSRMICDVSGDSIAWPLIPEEVIPNARLIAAAPELLEALERVCASWEAKGVGMTDALAMARAAIAKAKG
jgi:hypothetical protein